MKKILIFGNSGSGKTTLAKTLSAQHDLAHFDLDSIAWLATRPPQRKSLEESLKSISSFCEVNQSWVIEGCYSDLIDAVSDQANQMIFMNLSIELCVSNARSRPWEPHKYSSKEAQERNLPMLIDWITSYETRKDTFSKQAHTALYDHFDGAKNMRKFND